jgi:hypothetical protein
VGIIPGQTPWEEVKHFFDLLGKPATAPFSYPEYRLQAFNYVFRWSDSEQKLIDWTIQFHVKDNEIKLLAIGMQSDFKKPAFVTHYSLKAVLSALGAPTEVRVSIYIPRSPKVAITYFLNVYYYVDDLWLVFQYQGIADQLNSEVVEFCPVSPLYEELIPAVLSILIQSGDKLYSNEDLRNLGIPPLTGARFNLATGEDEQAFYKKTMASKGQVCFTSKVSFWGVMAGGDRVITPTPQ